MGRKKRRKRYPAVRTLNELETMSFPLYAGPILNVLRHVQGRFSARSYLTVRVLASFTGSRTEGALVQDFAMCPERVCNRESVSLGVVF